MVSLFALEGVGWEAPGGRRVLSGIDLAIGPGRTGLVGRNGVGKSTSLSKVCYYLQQKKLNVLIAACDTFRSGAVEQLKTHARRLKVEVFDEAASDSFAPKLEHSVTFTDTKGMQVIDIPNVAVGNEFSGGRVRMTVVEVYEGQDYPNLAVSEALVYLAEIDAATTLDTPPSSAHEDHFPDALVDGNARTFWSSGPDGAADSFTVEATGFGVSSIGITAGPRTHKRPKTLEITANNITETVTMEENARGMVWFPVAPLTGFTGSGFDEVHVRVTETWPGSSVDELAIAEVALRATNYSGL